MTKIKDALKKLDKGFQSGNFDDFFDLLNKNKSLIKAKFSDEGITLLHYLCKNGIHYLQQKSLKEDIEYTIDKTTYEKTLEKFIDQYEPDLNVQDKNGNTPFHYAVMFDNLEAVNTLLLYESIDIDKENDDSLTPLMIASNQGYKEIELAILEESNQAVNKTEIEKGKTVKEQQKERKTAIISIGSLKKLITEKPKAYEAIESVMFVENSDLAKTLTGKMQILSDDPLLGPMIAMMGLCAIRGTLTKERRQSLFLQKQSLFQDTTIDKSDSLYTSAVKQIEKDLGKKFKIICIDALDTTPLQIFSREPRGVYTSKNSVYIATKDADLPEILSYVIHESSHFIMQQLFQNSNNPFPNDVYFNPLRDRMLTIIDIVYNKIYELEKSSNSKEEKMAYGVIAQIYHFYDEKQWAAELIVRVPQIITLLGKDKGHDWLKTNLPDLYSFYAEVINPKIMEYLDQYKVNDYLDINIPKKQPTLPIKK